MGTMLDTVDDPRRTFSGLKVDAIAAYGNGKYANFRAARREFPNAHVLEIDVTGEGIGNVGDFEPGDMSYSRAGSWAKGRIAAGVHRPVLYFSASHWSEIMSSLRKAGLRRRDVRIWTAHYNGKPHLCSAACGFGISGRADATQWGSSDAGGTLRRPYAGRNVDVSKTSAKFLAGAPKGSGTNGGSGKGKETDDRAVHRTLHLSSPFTTGPDVRALQEAMKAGLRHYKVDWLPLVIDGELGPQTIHAAAFYGWILGVPGSTHRKVKNGVLPEAIQKILRNPKKRGAAYRTRSDDRKARLQQIRKAHKRGPAAAVAYAKAFLGITEEPPESNEGKTMVRHGKKGGIGLWEEAFGLGACPWCLCFACYCVRDVGGAQVKGLMVNAEEMERMAKAHSDGWVEVPSSEAKAGDIALFSVGGSGRTDHGELVVGPFRGGLTNDIGGNTSKDGSGSQSNGGGVFARKRPLSKLTCVARPLYQ